MLKTIIIAPMTSKGFGFIFRPTINFQEKDGLILLDQIRAVDKSRLVKKIVTVEEETAKKVSATLVEMFQY